MSEETTNPKCLGTKTNATLTQMRYVITTIAKKGTEQAISNYFGSFYLFSSAIKYT